MLICIALDLHRVLPKLLHGKFPLDFITGPFSRDSKVRKNTNAQRGRPY